MVLKKDGERYLVSPWALSWDDENYYLIAYDNNAGIIKHFRVDKMLKIDIESERRLGEAHFKQFDMAKYAKKMFGMFAGEEQIVKLECVNSFAGIIIDRFGQDVNLIKKDDEHFVVNVHVAVSRQFLAWVISLGDGIRIIGPDVVVEQMKTEVNRLMYQYLNTN
jgi:predicted DNA-binding transcriptional regulator YafY